VRVVYAGVGHVSCGVGEYQGYCQEDRVGDRPSSESCNVMGGACICGHMPSECSQTVANSGCAAGKSVCCRCGCICGGKQGSGRGTEPVTQSDVHSAQCGDAGPPGLPGHRDGHGTASWRPGPRTDGCWVIYICPAAE
jgi:hypothetical protein